MTESRRTRREQVQLNTAMEANGTHYFSTSRNLSECGVCLDTHHAFPVGAQLHLALALPVGLPSLVARTTVRWSKDGEGVGAEFVSLSGEATSNLARFLNSEV